MAHGVAIEQRQTALMARTNGAFTRVVTWARGSRSVKCRTFSLVKFETLLSAAVTEAHGGLKAPWWPCCCLNMQARPDLHNRTRHLAAIRTLGLN